LVRPPILYVVTVEAGHFAGRRAHTYYVYEFVIRRHLVPALGSIPLAKLTPQDVHRVQARMAAQQLSPATIGVARAVLSGALSQAEKWELVTRNVVRLVESATHEPREPKVLTPDQAAALRDAAKGEAFEHLFKLMLVTGLRIGEALGLQWRNVDLDGRMPAAHVRQHVV